VKLRFGVAHKGRRVRQSQYRIDGVQESPGVIHKKVGLRQFGFRNEEWGIRNTQHPQSQKLKERLQRLTGRQDALSSAQYEMRCGEFLRESEALREISGKN
jgi:hypothetical protein